MNEHPDRDLVALARGGDGAAIGELFSRYWRAARAAAFGVTGEFASAEDAAAEAFRQALAGMDSLRDPDRFGSWLRTIVVRKARLELQNRRPTVDASAAGLSDPSERPDDALERIEVGAVIRLAMGELADRLREAMALVYFEGYDTEAAARFLDIPAGTLRRRLHEGRGQLRGVVERILEGNRKMSEEREGQIQKFKSMIDKGEIYQALRESLALRPPPAELADLFHSRSLPPESGPQVIREIAQRLLRPSDRASDPNDPVGAIAAAIRKALPDFQDWPLDAAEAAARFFTSAGQQAGERPDRLQTLLPPGFAEGRPGAFLRPTRAFLHVSGDGPVQSIYQHLQASPDERAFVAAKGDMRISDALDLTWMVAGPLELRQVQELLERLITAVMPGKQARFSTYGEPRYRSALQLQGGGLSARLAHGGVLAVWPGRPQGVDAAHVRIFLEPWATVRSGQAVEFDRVPSLPPAPGCDP